MMAALLSHKSAHFLTIVLLGLSYFSVDCDARAVNVSNTWTMPQEGLNVFYRFFRDRISWFEADAVCQFHHANLVTVDNSFQFDATRDLLRELDVNDIVWIGLMRPQNGERFMWSNSRPLVADTGYWAESLPLMDAPLCAVIDPIRDYRWHALRCGGPETASFLCEMPVPSWAEACILRDMPNLTMQYMADTASIELIRNCEEEGLIRQSCKSKLDRERVIRELICPRERLEAQRINDITNSHFKSLQIINSIRTDNNENNDIELLPLGQNYEPNRDLTEEVQTEKNTVQRLIEQFNVDELMQADEPLGMNNGFIIPGEIPKPVKKTSKKVIITAGNEYPPKKDKFQKFTSNEQQQQQQQQKTKKQQMIALEDMMMGDQPMQQGEPEMPDSHTIDDDVSNEIMEPLPHKKKVLPQDLRTMSTITERSNLNEEQEAELPQKNKFSEEKPNIPDMTTETASSTTIKATNPITATTTTITLTTTKTTTAADHAPVTDIDFIPSKMIAAMKPMEDEDGATILPEFADSTTIHAHVTGLPAATIGHPMHPQQPRNNIVTEETQPLHVKESVDSSHFIPPMLMVKSHYVPPTKHGEHGEHVDVHHNENGEHVERHLHPNEHTQAHHEHIDKLETTVGSTANEDIKIIEETHEFITETTEATLSETSSTSIQPKTHEKIIEQPSVHPNNEPNEEKNPLLLNANRTENKEINSNTESTITTTTLTTTTAKIVPSTIKHTELVTNSEPKDPTVTSKPITESAYVSSVATTEHQTPMRAVETTTARQTTVNIVHTTSPISPETTTITTTERPEIQKIETATSGGNVDKQETSPTPVVTTTLATSQPIIISAATTPTSTATTTTTTTTTTTKIKPITATSSGTSVTTVATPIMTTTTTDAPLTSTHNFLKEDTETPFKPNRRRSLTKPETVNYFKKILG